MCLFTRHIVLWNTGLVCTKQFNPASWWTTVFIKKICCTNCLLFTTEGINDKMQFLPNSSENPFVFGLYVLMSMLDVLCDTQHVETVVMSCGLHGP